MGALDSSARVSVQGRESIHRKMLEAALLVEGRSDARLRARFMVCGSRG
jgi:hypothetical protein